jgi:hypothetical protein
MFGYFVRRVDKRFQLERSLGVLPQNKEEAVARLERLFAQARPFCILIFCVRKLCRSLQAGSRSHLIFSGDLIWCAGREC